MAITQKRCFKGVVGTGINSEVLSEVVRSYLAVAFQSDAIIIDKEGTIKYSANQSSIGNNVLSPEYNSRLYALAPESKEAIDSLLADLAGTKAGSQDIQFQQNIYTFAYSPIEVEGTNFLMLYVFSPHTLTTEMNGLVDQQRTTSSIIIATIGAIAIGVGFLIVSWNKRLTSAVDERTKELKTKSEQLLAHDKMQQEFISSSA